MCRIPKHVLVFPLMVLAVLGSALAGVASPPDGIAIDSSSTEVPHAYYSGNGFLNRGLFDLAAAEYRAFLAEHADSDKAPMARYGLAVSLFRLGTLEEALPELKLLHGDDDFVFAAEVATMLGQCRLANREYGEAAAAFESVLKRHADHALADDAAAQLVEALYRGGHHKEAAAKCEAFTSKWGDSPHRDRAEYFGGLADMGQGGYASAVKKFQSLVKRPDGEFAEHAGVLLAQCHHRNHDLKAATAAYRVALLRAESPYRAEALFGLATILRQERRIEDAAALVDEILEKHTTSPLIGSARLLRGRVWFDIGDYPLAAKAFQQVPAENGPLAADAAYWSAKCKLRLGSFDEAARDLKQAIEKHADSELLPEMRYDRAVALLRSGKRKAAAKVLAAFRSDFPDHVMAPDALHLLATIAHQEKAYDRSQEHVRVFLKDYAKHPLAAKVSFLSAENAYLAGNYKRGAKEYRKFLDKHGGHDLARTARYRLGMSLYRQGNVEEALALLSEIDPKANDAEAFHALHLALGDIHFQRGEWKQAAEHLSWYVDGKSDTAAADDALLKLGLSFARLGQHEEAIRRYDRLLEHFNNRDSVHQEQASFERGQALVALGQYDEAAAAFNRVLSGEGDSRFAAPARRHLASISLRRGDPVAAARQFKRVAKATRGTEGEAEALFQQGEALMAAREFGPAEKVFRRLIDRFESHDRAAAARGHLAIAVARQDRHKEALELAEQVDLSGLSPAFAASLAYEKAWCLRETGDDDGAAKVYRKLIDGGCGGELLAHALFELAEIEAGGGRHGEAVTLLRRLHKDGGASGKALLPSLAERAAYRLGTSLFQDGKHGEAAEVLGKFVGKYGDSPLLISASFFCGESLFELGKHGAAIEQFERVVGGSRDDAAFGPSLLRLGECLTAQQRWAKSEEAFTRYIERFETGEQWFQAAFGMGWARENQGRFDEAVAAYERVVAKHKGPTAARAQFQIGQCLFAKKQYEDAVRELLKVDILYAYPKWSAAALYEAGRCFEKLSRTAEAREQFKTVVEKHGETKWAQMASKHITTLASESLPGR